VSHRSISPTELAILQMTVDPRATSAKHTSTASEHITPRGVRPSRTRTADLGRQQLLPVSREKNKPNDTPLWSFLGSPSKSAALSSVMWGSVAGLAAHILTGFTALADKAGARLLPVLGTAIGVGAAVAVVKANKTRKQNHVYEAWMDLLGDERATLGMLRDAEAQGLPLNPRSSRRGFTAQG